MSARNRIPSALEPYLRLPSETSLILLTGTLGCSVNWLTARFAGSLLGNVNPAVEFGSEGVGKETAVILVSFIRDGTFWKNEIKRAMGIETTKLLASGRYSFVDCFTALHASKQNDPLEIIEKAISDAIAKASEPGNRDVVLLLDSPDAFLALNLAPATAFSVLLLKLRSLVYATIMTCSADQPLLAASTPSPAAAPTPIEADGAAFVVQQAHDAHLVMSMRELDTGAAKDVSGVLRATRGGTAYSWEGEEHNVVEMEALYLVQRDGNAKVFERGALGT